MIKYALTFLFLIMIHNDMNHATEPKNPDMPQSESQQFQIRILENLVVEETCGLYMSKDDIIAAFQKHENKPFMFHTKKYPEEVSFGDTVYVQVNGSNISDQPINVNFEITGLFPFLDTTRYCFYNQQDYSLKWDIAFPLNSLGYIDDILATSTKTIVPPQSNVPVLLLSLNVPMLDDLHEPFWDILVQKLAEEDQRLVFEIKKMSLTSDNGNVKHDLQKLGCVITVKPRPVFETHIIEALYLNMPDEMFPRYEESLFGIRKISENFYRKKLADRSLYIWPNQMVRKKSIDELNKKGFYSQDFWSTLPNVDTTTWQGWQEIEKSLTPSTMRDEIRLTRIIIQYCDTKDQNILEELKEWFSGMNEIQRACMAKSILDRAKNCYGTVLLDPYRDIYHTIREYDISAKTESEVEHLKNLKLLE